MKIQRVTSHQERLWRSALEETLPEITSEDTFLSEKDFTSALEDTRCYALVATDDIPDRPVGILTAYRFPNLTAPGDLVYLYDIVVVPGHRCRGVATALISALIEQCRSDRVVRIWAGTGQENLPAHLAFYRTGARKIGETYTEYEWLLNASGVTDIPAE